ncbi:MAG: hypothetical protein ACRDBG_19755 [Waterburya sp.]
MKVVIALHGYANVGKTTAIDYLERRFDISTISTSAVLHQTLEDLIYAFAGRRYDSYDKTNALSIVVSDKYGECCNSMTNREALITLAEDVLVKNYGRLVFAQVFVNAINNLPDNELIVLETIGGNEWLTAKSALDSDENIKIVEVNLRAKGDDVVKVDSRELSSNPDFTIINNMDNYLFRDLDILMDTLRDVLI